jgi:uncharacterized protein (TIGR03083 family)
VTAGIAALLRQLATDGPLLAAAAERAGWDAPVPSTDWTVRELVTHVGGVHRWATDIVARGGDTFDTDIGDAVGTGPADADLLDWFTAGHAALVDTLLAAPDDLQCATFLPAPSPRAFWARRQAHETAIHRVDAESAGGPVTAFEADFAQDGIGELLQGFAARKREPLEAATLVLRASDGPSWQITLGAEGVRAEQGAGAADVLVEGSSSELYLWLWNRASPAVVSGDAAIARRWAETVQIRWS